MPTQKFIGKKAVHSVVDLDAKTPAGGKMLKVNFDDGSVEIMPEKRFNVITSEEPTDATFVRGLLVTNAAKEIGAVVYGMLHEYGMKLSEVDKVLDSVIVILNGASEKASNVLWGIDYADDRTLNQINDILVENAKKDTNDGSSTRAGTTSQNTN